MRNDQIFVLLLVVLLPLSGCFENTVGDAEGADEPGTTIVNNYFNQSDNVPPVFHTTTVGLGGDGYSVSTYNSSTGNEESRMYFATLQMFFSVTDVDSNITNVGLDLDLDQVIDHEFGNNGSWSDISIYRSPGIAQANGSMANYGYSAYADECFARINLIALDDKGGKTIQPHTVRIEDMRAMHHDVRGCQDDYTGADH